MMLPLFFLLAGLSCLRPAHAGAGSTPKPFTSMFSFGDSYADTGNLVRLLGGPLVLKNPPYGETYFGHPTGRASNGRLVLDFIADALNLPFVPPYWAERRSFAAGANFAVVGAPALQLSYFLDQNITSLFPVNSSLGDQLGWFEQLKPSLCNTTPGCADPFAKSLFIMGEFGGNDYGAALAANRTVAQTSRDYVPKVVDAIANGVERLINHGAKFVVVADMFPLGCLPGLLTLYPSPDKADYDHHGCLKSLNALLSLRHNSLLRQRVEALRSKHPRATIIAADYYRPFLAFLQNPEHFGFNGSAAVVACCGGGGPYNFSPRAQCGGAGATACGDPSRALLWDGYHLTESAYRSIAGGWLHGPYADPPILRAAP